MSYSVYKIFDLTQSGENISAIAKEWEDFFHCWETEHIVKDNSGKLNPIVVPRWNKYIILQNLNIAEFGKSCYELNKQYK